MSLAKDGTRAIDAARGHKMDEMISSENFSAVETDMKSQTHKNYM